MTSPDCERMTKPPQKLSRSDSRPKNSFGNPYNAFQKLFLWSTIQYNTKHRVLKHNVTMYTHPQPRSVQMLSVAGSFPCSSYRNSHCYGRRAPCVQRCVPVASLWGRLSAACYGKAGIPCCAAVSPMRLMYLGRNSITSPGVSHRFEIEDIADYLGREYCFVDGFRV